MPVSRKGKQKIGRDGNVLSGVSHSKITIGGSRRSLLGTLAALATIAGTVLAIIVFAQAGKATDAPGPGPAPFSVLTRIVNTGTDGVFAYPQPRHGAHYPDGYLEGSAVSVVCQERDGEPMTDRNPVPGQPAAWPVWDKLTDGRWIPDLWTNLPKRPGATPPNDLPTC